MDELTEVNEVAKGGDDRGHGEGFGGVGDAEICLDADRRSKGRGKGRLKIQNWTSYFKFWIVVNENPRGLIPTLLLDSHQTKQHPRNRIRE